MNENIGYKDIFRQKEYMKMIVASLINRFGDSIDAIASTWIVYEITESAAWSAIIFALNKIPTVVVTPFAGAWVEGRNKKAIMVATDIIRAICVAIVATGYLMGFLTPWILAFTTITISTAEAFRGPANMALTPKILEKKYYSYGMSLLTTLSSIVELVGTALAAGIIAFIGTAGAIYLDMVTFFLSAAIIMFVNSKEQGLSKQKFDATEYFETLKDGIKYVKREKAVLYFCGLAIFLNAILVPLNGLQAPLSTEILHGGAEILSILGIAITAGMIVGSAVYPVIQKSINNRGVVLLGGTGIGVYYLAIVCCEPLYDSRWFMYGFVSVLSFLLGMFATLLNSFMNVGFVSELDEAYFARAAAVTTALSSAATPVVSFIISAIAVMVNVEWLFIIAGILDLAVMPFFLRGAAFNEDTEDSNQMVVETVSVE